MQIRPTAFTIGLIIHPSIALFCVYTEFGIDSLHHQKMAQHIVYNLEYVVQFCLFLQFYHQAI